MKETILALVLAASLVLVPVSQAQAAMTSNQVNAIIYLLQVFGVDQDVVDNVSVILSAQLDPSAPVYEPATYNPEQVGPSPAPEPPAEPVGVPIVEEQVLAYEQLRLDRVAECEKILRVHRSGEGVYQRTQNRYGDFFYPEICENFLNLTPSQQLQFNDDWYAQYGRPWFSESLYRVDGGPWIRPEREEYRRATGE